LTDIIITRAQIPDRIVPECRRTRRLYAGHSHLPHAECSWDPPAIHSSYNSCWFQPTI